MEAGRKSVSRRLPTVHEGAPKQTKRTAKKKLIGVWKFAPQSRTKADKLSAINWSRVKLLFINEKKK